MTDKPYLPSLDHNPDHVTAFPGNNRGPLDPVENLTARIGQAASEARRKTDSLSATFRELALVTGQLEQHGVEVQVDLGPIGNSAFARFQDLEKERSEPTFSLPAV